MSQGLLKAAHASVDTATPGVGDVSRRTFLKYGMTLGCRRPACLPRTLLSGSIVVAV
jgi:hypothetical protein